MRSAVRICPDPPFRLVFMFQEKDYSMHRLVLAVLIIGGFLFAWQHFYEGPRQRDYLLLKKEQERTRLGESSTKKIHIEESEYHTEAAPTPTADQDSKNVPIHQKSRSVVNFKNSRIEGGINLYGARIDKLVLFDYKEDQVGEEKVNLLTDDELNPYSVTFGWLPVTGVTKENLPNAQTKWRIAHKTDRSIKLETVKDKMLFKISFDLDDNYLFTVNQSIQNLGSSVVYVKPYTRIKRTLNIDKLSTDSYQGPLGLIRESLKEVPYSDLLKKRFIGEHQSSELNEWFGVSDKYWLVAVAPKKLLGYHVAAQAIKKSKDGTAVEINLVGSDQFVSPKSTVDNVNYLFAGAKNVNILDLYSDKFKLLDRAIDFGLFYFIAKPVLLLLRWLFGFVGNYGLAIILMTIIVRLILLPLAGKSYSAMAKIKNLSPKINNLKEIHKGDQMTLNKEIMGLYRAEKINPLASFVPILFQIPIFFALYKVLYVSIEMRHSPFFGWIVDLSAPDGLSIFNLFGLIPFAVPQFLQIGPLTLLMGFTIWLQQKLSSAPIQDPAQAKIMNYLPFILIFLFAGFPTGLMLYWIVSNIFGVIQQYIMTRYLKSS